MGTHRGWGVVVADLMTHPVVTLTSGQSLPTAEALMKLKRFRHLPVVDMEDHLVGLVTHRDLLASKISSLAPLTDQDRGELQGAVPVASIMQAAVWSVSPDTSALAAAEMLRDHAFGCLPVVERGRLVGIVTEADFLSLLIGTMRLEPCPTPTPPPGSPDPPLPRAGPTTRRAPLVIDGMTPLPHSIQLDASFDEAVELMRRYGVRHLPVREGEELVGVLSERDVLVAEAARGPGASVDLPVRAICTRPPHVVDTTARLDNVAFDMAARRLGSVLVVDRGELVGILTTTDVCRVLGECTRTLALG